MKYALGARVHHSGRGPGPGARSGRVDDHPALGRIPDLELELQVSGTSPNQRPSSNVAHFDRSAMPVVVGPTDVLRSSFLLELAVTLSSWRSSSTQSTALELISGISYRQR